MKNKSLLIALFLLTSLFSYSQIEVNKFYIGLNTPLSFNSNSVKEIYEDTSRKASESIDFSFSPKIGYTFLKNIVGGIGATFTFSDSEFDFTNLNSSSYVITPFLKYYYPLNKFKPFAQIEYGFGNSYSDFLTIYPDGSNAKGERKLIKEHFLVGAGMAYFFNKNISMELSFNYTNNHNKTNDTNLTFESEFVTNNFNSTIGFSLFL